LPSAKFEQTPAAIPHLFLSNTLNDKECPMPAAPRITVDTLKRRMDEGEDFTLIDTRNPAAWAQSDAMMPGAIRIPLDELEDNLLRIPKGRPAVAYCT
jgi:rhodanese-related sulfurtransferase